MKNLHKLLPLLLTILLFASCEPSDKDIDNARNRLNRINEELYSKRRQVDGLSQEIHIAESQLFALKQKNTTLEKVEEGKKPIYLLTIEFKQSNFTLDLEQHFKNAMNSFEITIPVDEDYYYKHDRGSRISESFRMGSLIIGGKFGEMNVTVINKEIIYI